MKTVRRLALRSGALRSGAVRSEDPQLTTEQANFIVRVINENRRIVDFDEPAPRRHFTEEELARMIEGLDEGS